MFVFRIEMYLSTTYARELRFHFIASIGMTVWRILIPQLFTAGLQLLIFIPLLDEIS